MPIKLSISGTQQLILESNDEPTLLAEPKVNDILLAFTATSLGSTSLFVDVGTELIESCIYITDEMSKRGIEVQVKSGELYITNESGSNPFLLSGQLASYIEIDRLGDAFGTLLDMQSEEDRWRFLIPKGIKLADYDRMKAIFGLDEKSAESSDDSLIITQKLDSEFDKLVKSGLSIQGTSGGTTSEQRLPSEGIIASSSTEKEHKELPVPEEFRFPDFDPVSVEFEDYKAGSGKVDAGTPKQTGSGAKISSWTPPSPSRTKAIGKRGEQVVWGKELQRLHDLGYPDPHQILQWVSKDNETSNYDFASKDENNNDIWIEAKATEDDSDDFSWPKAEIDLAISARNRYYIYRVYRATTPNPRIKRFQDPIGLWLKGELSLNFSVLKGNLPNRISEDNP